MPKTTQCMKLNVQGVSYVCTFTPGRRNAYQLYRTWWDDGMHRRKVEEYANFESVLYYLIGWGHREFKLDYFPAADYTTSADSTGRV